MSVSSKGTAEYITICQSGTAKTCEGYLDSSEFDGDDSAYLSPCDICTDISHDYLKLCENCKNDTLMKY